jgi:acyl-CoA reductase-like NAD-dependent aldehyde dehydrogenase
MSSTTSSRISFAEFHNIVNGKLRSAEKTYNGINPTTEAKLWDVPVATESDLNDAVKAARRAFPSWAGTPIEERKRLVTKWAEIYQSYEDEFTELMIRETGKPRTFARGEVKGAYNLIMHHSVLFHTSPQSSTTDKS